MEPVTIHNHGNKRLPAEDAVYRHYMPVQLRFSDIDLVGHVNNSVYITLFDTAKTRYYIDVQPDAARLANVELVIVNINCEFFEPTYFTEAITVYTRVTRISARSVTMEQRIVADATGRTKARCVTVLAGFDAATATGAPVNPALAGAMESYENQKLIESL